jgi:hypothetical protein
MSSEPIHPGALFRLKGGDTSRRLDASHLTVGWDLAVSMRRNAPEGGRDP